MTNGFELEDVELNDVCGGEEKLTCAQAQATRDVLVTVGRILNAMGQSDLGVWTWGYGNGMVGATCPGK